MKKRRYIFYAVCFICTAAVILSAVIGSRSSKTYIIYPEPDFTNYASDGVSTYSDESERTLTTDVPVVNQTVNINTASTRELADILPGIGEVKAQNIVDYREAVGGFNSIDELMEVDGIGEATLEKIRPYCVI